MEVIWTGRGTELFIMDLEIVGRVRFRRQEAVQREAAEADVAPPPTVADPGDAVAVPDAPTDTDGAAVTPADTDVPEVSDNAAAGPDLTAAPADTPLAAADVSTTPLSLRRPPHQRVQVGSYAAVFDHKIGQTRWLRLAQRAAAARMLIFSDFCEEVTVRVRYDDFDADVNEGRSRLL